MSLCHYHYAVRCEAWITPCNFAIVFDFTKISSRSLGNSAIYLTVSSILHSLQTSKVDYNKKIKVFGTMKINPLKVKVI